MFHTAYYVYHIRGSGIVKPESVVRHLPISLKYKNRVLDTIFKNQHLEKLGFDNWMLVNEFMYDFRNYGLFQKDKNYIIVCMFDAWVDHYLPMNHRVLKRIWK